MQTQSSVNWKKSESKDYIIGFLTATIDGLRHLDSEQVQADTKEEAIKQLEDFLQLVA